MGVKSGVVKIASTDWAFATCEKTPFPGVPDPTHICLKNGFNPSLLYELQYTGERSARPWHRLRGHARSQLVLPL